MDLSTMMINFRIKNQMTQTELARLLGTTSVTVSNLERRKHKPTKRTLTKIKMVIGGGIDDDSEEDS